MEMESLSGTGGAMASAAFAALQDGAGDAELLKLSEEPNALEWRKTVLAASQEQTVAGKIDAVNDYFAKNVTLADTPVPETGSLNKVIATGKASELESAVAKYQTLNGSGISSESMNIVVTQESAFVAVRDKAQTLVADMNTFPGLPCKNASALPQASAPAYGLNSGGMLQFTPVTAG